MDSKLDALRSTDTSLRTAAIVGGLGLLIMAILAPVANFSLLQNLVVPGDAAATANNISASAGPFRLSITLFVIVCSLDLVVAWGLYILLRPVNRDLSLLAAWLRVAYAAIFASALNNLVVVSQLLGGSGYLRAVPADQLHAQVMSSLDAYVSGWDLALIIFGLHLLLLGYLVFRSGYIPRLLGVLLVISGLGYLVEDIGRLLSPNFAVTLTTFTFVGEVVFLLWLLWKAVRGFDRKPQ